MILENVLLLFRQSLEERLLDCYIESCEGAPKDKVRDTFVVITFENIFLSLFLMTARKKGEGCFKKISSFTP